MVTEFSTYLHDRVTSLTSYFNAEKAKEAEYDQQAKACEIANDEEGASIAKQMSLMCNSHAAGAHDMISEVKQIQERFNTLSGNTAKVEHTPAFVLLLHSLAFVIFPGDGILRKGLIGIIDNHDTEKLETLGNAIRASIESCVTLPQLNTCSRMLINLQNLFSPSNQLAGIVSSLELQIYNKVKELQ